MQSKTIKAAAVVTAALALAACSSTNKPWLHRLSGGAPGAAARRCRTAGQASAPCTAGFRAAHRFAQSRRRLRRHGAASVIHRCTGGRNGIGASSNGYFRTEPPSRRSWRVRSTTPNQGYLKIRPPPRSCTAWLRCPHPQTSPPGRPGCTRCVGCQAYHEIGYPESWITKTFIGIEFWQIVSFLMGFWACAGCSADATHPLRKPVGSGL